MIRPIFAILALTTAAHAAPSWAKCRAELIRWEGYRVIPYRDGESWSVGIGHNLTANGQTPKSYYSPAEIDRFFANDLSWALDACRQGVRNFDALPERVQLVAIGVAFGVGRTGFHKMHSFRKALTERNFPAARTALKGYRWAKQVSPTRLQNYLRNLH